MYSEASNTKGGRNRYSAKNMHKPVSFICRMKQASRVSVIGDFNGWDPDAHPMKRMPDGNWHTDIPLHHGHHRYLFLVDGEQTLDPNAQGTVRDEADTPLSLIAVS